MKTKEEILKEKLGMIWTYQDFEALGPIVYEAMQLYSDQQNKELWEEREQLAEQYRKDGEQINDMIFEINKLKEDRPFQFSPTNSEREWQVKIVNDYIHPNQEDWQKMNAVCNSLIEIQRLTKEVEELKVSKWVNAEIKPLGEVILMTSSRVQIIGDWYEGGWRTHRSKWENGVYKSAFNEGDIVAWHPLPEESMWRPTTLIGNQSEEIQRLKKQVEELSWVEDEIDTAREWMKVHKGENSRYLQIQEENTRLRELLGRSKDYIFLGYVGAVELCDAIDNELNPKYNPPYIEGKTDLQNEG